MTLFFCHVVQMVSFWLKLIESCVLADTLSGLHQSLIHRDSFITKRVRSAGILCAILPRVFAGNCYHNKRKLLFGKRLAWRNVMLLGEANFMHSLFTSCLYIAYEFMNYELQGTEIVSEMNWFLFLGNLVQALLYVVSAMILKLLIMVYSKRA